jgi:uroporphyrinogen III methyltransferase/synthase
LKKVLKNINIVLTRAKDQSVETIKKLSELGANVISFPTIQITTIKGDQILDETVRNINSFNSLIFTSENAVNSFLQKLEELNIPFDPKAFFVISIGEKTSNFCLDNGFRVDFQPKISSSEALLEELQFMDLLGRKIFVPSSTLANIKQFSALERHGAKITAIPIYINRVNDEANLENELKILNETRIDLFIFTSPSTFKGLIEILKIKEPNKYFENKITAVIGPVTEKAVLDAGVNPTIIPNNFSMNYLIEEIIEFYSKEKIIN